MLLGSVDDKPQSVVAATYDEARRSPTSVQLAEPLLGRARSLAPVRDHRLEPGYLPHRLGRDLADRCNERRGFHRPGLRSWSSREPSSLSLRRALVSRTFLRRSSESSADSLSSTSRDTSRSRGRCEVSSARESGNSAARRGEPSRASARRSCIRSCASKRVSRPLSRASPARSLMEPRSSLPLRGARNIPARIPAAPPSKKVLSRCLSSTFVCLPGASSLILTAFCARHRDPVTRRAGVQEERRGAAAGPLGDARDPVGNDLDRRVGGVLYGDVLHRLDADPPGALDDVVVDLAYLPEVGDVLLGRAAHRGAKGADVEPRAVHVLVGEVHHERADVRVVPVAVQYDLRHQVHPLDDEVGPVRKAPIHDRLDPHCDLRGLLPETEEDPLLLLDRHPEVLALYLVGALVEYGEEIRAYGAPEDLADRVRPYDALDVEAPGDVGGERARPHPGRSAEEHHDRLGGLAQDAPLVQPADDYGVLLGELVPNPGQDLFFLDRVALLGQELGAHLAGYLVRQLGPRSGLGEGLRQDAPGERCLPVRLDYRYLPFFHSTPQGLLVAQDAESPVLPAPSPPDAVEKEQQKGDEEERHQRHHDGQDPAHQRHHVLESAQDRRRYARRSHVRRRSQDGFEHGDHAGYAAAGGELRNGLDAQPRLERRREQHRAGGDPDRGLDDVQDRVESRDLVEPALHERERQKRPDNQPVAEQIEGRRQLEEPEPGEDTRERERQVGPHPRHG